MNINHGLLEAIGLAPGSYVSWFTPAGALVGHWEQRSPERAVGDA